MAKGRQSRVAKPIHYQVYCPTKKHAKTLTSTDELGKNVKCPVCGVKYQTPQTMRAYR
jgi:hypothetical protein